MERSKHQHLISIGVLLVLHVVGVVGMLLPDWRPLFLSLTPLHLLITALLILSNDPHPDRKFIGAGLGVFTGGFLLEVAGVHTGVLFGEYTYGPTLGFKLFEVPLAIGLNWLTLVYSSAMITGLFLKNKWLRVLTGAALMVSLDLLIEPVAIQLNFWHWVGGEIPLQNYLMWFVGAVILKWFWFTVSEGWEKKNPVAVSGFLIQTAFFAALLFGG